MQAAGNLREDRLAASRLVYRAQGFRKAVVPAPVGGREPARIAPRDEARERRVVELRKVAGDDEPGGIGVPCLRGDDSRNRAAALGAIHDLRIRRAKRLARLPGAHRDEGFARVAGDEVEGLGELRPGAVGERRLVGSHATRLPACEHEAEERGHGAASAAKSLFPPDFSSSRSDSMTMPCESDLHMS